ncbi:hypothetical protein FGO68_gene3576 [Halteria grandinella]|uniref:Uncharacterized protein n=1 Tax=Halteria grandinella TaxID=5974 RepID=A0A8J8NXG2_HALGN|nr:hypothetical protein FGO68_gene3576 [Halteria grandinella]
MCTKGHSCQPHLSSSSGLTGCAVRIRSYSNLPCLFAKAKDYGYCLAQTHSYLLHFAQDHHQLEWIRSNPIIKEKYQGQNRSQFKVTILNRKYLIIVKTHYHLIADFIIRGNTLRSSRS